jgi:ribonuclease-3
MSDPPHLSLIELLRSSSPDVPRIVSTFVTRFNAAYGVTGREQWDITKEEWQRYEFLGDRVMNLIVAQTLFTQRDSVLSEGEMTRILSSVVSNRALDGLTRRYGDAFARLIPKSIAEQNTYGERVTGGAFEAFIGALYCEAGIDEVAFFVNAIIGDAISPSAPDQNVVGVLQEHFQKNGGALPEYREVARGGPDHKPFFTYQVVFNHEVLGEGSGESIQLAKQAAAKKALENTGKKH